MSNVIFLENFQTLISMVEDYGGEIGIDPSGDKKELVAEGHNVENAREERNRKATANANNRYLAMAMLTTSDFTRYSRLLEDLYNIYTRRND
jgi:hypothetical protein